MTACYIHAGVFVPVFHPLEVSEAFSFSPINNPSIKLRYWDEAAYVSELVISSPSTAPTSNLGKSSSKSTADLAASAAEKEGLSSSKADSKSKKRKAEVKEGEKIKKTVPAHLQFWSNRHAELHGTKSHTKERQESEEGNPAMTKEGLDQHGESSPPRRSYADPIKQCCYLCSRQFKTQAEVNKHERISQLHRDNLASDDLISKALAKLAKAGITPPAPDDDASDYRDRARERRAAFGIGQKTTPTKQAVGDKKTELEQEYTAPLASKGASLLGKMGWAAGTGLGAQGTGRTAPIAMEMYVSGVGLGAQGGKMGDAVEEAQRNTKSSYGEFLERTRDKAKERFEQMG